jgi:DHA1 family 2-module integral membrane pump EmrD-like MFS transporter
MQVLIAIILLSCAQFGSQIFLPALPAIAEHFAISDNQAQQLIMLYYVSFGLSQLVYGPWCDAVGSRRVFLIGQVFFIMGCLLGAMAQSPEMLGWGRILQGLGAGAPLIISRTLLSETLQGDKLKQAVASLAIAASVFAVMAPLLGGWITTSASWQTLFFVVACYLMLAWFIGFSLLNKTTIKRTVVPVKSIIKDYTALMTDLRFVTTAAFKWLPTLLFLSSHTLFPFEFQQKLSITAQQYGLYMTIPACGLILGTTLVKILQRSMSAKNLLLLFFPLLLLSGIGLYAQPFSLVGSLIFYSLFMVSAGAYYPCVLQMIIAPHPTKVGTVNALTSAVDMFIFSALAALINQYWVHDSQTLGLLYLVTSVILALCWLLIHYQDKNTSTDVIANKTHSNDKEILCPTKI